MVFFSIILLAASAGESGIEAQIQRLAQVYAVLEQEGATPADPNQAIYEGAIPGMLRQLDPHSVFFTPGQFDQLKELERSTSKGFGTVVSVLPGRVIVLQTLPGTPSAKAGIEPGDEILAVNGIRLDWLDMEQLIQLLGESRRREAKLDVRRQGSPRLLQFVMTPEELASESVDRAFLLREGTGYIRATSFEAETGKQIRAAIEKLGGKALQGLVLDLRDNPGGLLPAALETAALFLPAGKKILTVRGRSAGVQEPTVPDSNDPYQFPLAILINSRSASAAEIVAGAMQDYDRAIILGEASYGKGLVQSIYPLSHGTGIALTTAFYFTPSGRSIQKPLPTGQLDSSSRWAQLKNSGEFRTANGRRVSGGGGIEPDIVVPPERQTRLRAFLDASASITTFATEYIRERGTIPPDFIPGNDLLDRFQGWLAQRNVLPGISEWSADREWIRSRLHQEIFNQALGVRKGDEVELRRDAVVRRALDELPRR